MLTVVFLLSSLVIVVWLLRRNWSYRRRLSHFKQLTRESPYRKHYEKRHAKTSIASRYLGKEEQGQAAKQEIGMEDPSLVQVKRLDTVDEYKSAKDDMEIVGVARPIGRWTAFVIKHKLPLVLALLMQNKNNGGKSFWVNMVKARESSRGHDQSKGR